MKCCRCGRPLSVAALTVQSKAGPLVFGPVCARKSMPATPKQRNPRHVAPVVQRDPKTVDWVMEVAA